MIQTCLLFTAKLQDRQKRSLYMQKRIRGNKLRGKALESTARPAQCVWMQFPAHRTAFAYHL